MKEQLLSLALILMQGILFSVGRQIGDSLDIKTKTIQTTAIVKGWFNKK